MVWFRAVVVTRTPRATPFDPRNARARRDPPPQVHKDIEGEDGVGAPARADDADAHEFHKFFPSFVWVVRDFALDLVDDLGDSISPDQCVIARRAASCRLLGRATPPLAASGAPPLAASADAPAAPPATPPPSFPLPPTFGRPSSSSRRDARSRTARAPAPPPRSFSCAFAHRPRASFSRALSPLPVTRRRHYARAYRPLLATAYDAAGTSSARSRRRSASTRRRPSATACGR